MTDDKPLVALALPNRAMAGCDGDALCRGIAAKATGGRFDIAPGCCWTSILPYTFNTLWAGFLTGRRGWPCEGGEKPIRYFAMIHDDIKPAPGWLDRLVEILEEYQADVVSVVIPIKDRRGLTSTGVDSTGDPWNPRRLTMREVYELPVVFGDAEAGGPVLLNSGLWVCRFDADWCEKVAFRQKDRIVVEGGKFIPETRSEDWDFSRQVRAQGGKLLATRAVGVEHERPEWHNKSPWGDWGTDLDLVAELKAKRGVRATEMK